MVIVHLTLLASNKRYIMTYLIENLADMTATKARAARSGTTTHCQGAEF